MLDEIAQLICHTIQYVKYMHNIEKVDILFNCAGIVHHGTILECEDKDWDFSFALNVKSMFRMCKAFIPKMTKQNIPNWTPV